MARGTPGSVHRQLRAVFGAGTVSGLTDAELLERFRARRDDGASFEALVTRHGPMVLAVCRALLVDEYAAEDAFQATFLVLVRKARSVRVKDSLGPWLYGVAHRVARHARADAARRRTREGTAVIDPPAATTATPPDRAERVERSAALHEELARLPESYRVPIVLCHLEGLTQEEAALRLHWPLGTVRSRLARGRERLRGRLVRRGVTPTVALAALEAKGRTTASAAVSARLASLTVSAALSTVGAGLGPVAVSISGPVLALTEGVLLTMRLAPWKLAAGLLSAGLLTIVPAVTVLSARPGPPAPAPASETPPPEFPKIKTPAREATDQPQPKPEPRPSPEGRPSVPSSRLSDRDDLAPFLNDVSPQELSARYQAALASLPIFEAMYRQGDDTLLTWKEARGRAAILRAQIEGLIDRYKDELELLQVQLKKQQAEIIGAKGRAERTMAQADIYRRLNTRHKGSVSHEEIKKNEAEMVITKAELQGAEAEEEMVQVRIRQTERRLESLKKLLSEAGPLPPESKPVRFPPPPPPSAR